MNQNAATFLEVYRDVLTHGQKISPRGLECVEKVDYKFTLDMQFSPLTSFTSRNLNLNYAKREFLWYLGADPFDTSIEQHATMWAKIKQPNGSYFSNYGQYIFPDQFEFVMNELINDRDSRRASIVLLQPYHLFPENKDVVCTYGINFRIRNDELHMTVMMRSNDLVFGTTNDVFCFGMLYRMMYACLVDRLNIGIGKYTHFVNSLHIYQRHYEMVNNILKDGKCGYYPIDIPWPTEHESLNLIQSKGKYTGGEFSKWLNT